MPPNPWVYDGLEAIRPLLERGVDRARRMAPRADEREPDADRGELPARRAATTRFRAFKFDVLRIEEGGIVEITTFGPALFDAFGLPPTL